MDNAETSFLIGGSSDLTAAQLAMGAASGPAGYDARAYTGRERTRERGEPPRPSSYIEPHEEAEAREIIAKHFAEISGKPFTFRPTGYFLIGKLYVRPEELLSTIDDNGEKKTLYLPKIAQDEDKHQAVAMLVCAMGSMCYRGTDAAGQPRFPDGAWCKVGDWVAIPRYEAFPIMHHGVAMAILPDDKILGVVEDPTDIIATHVADRV